MRPRLFVILNIRRARDFKISVHKNHRYFLNNLPVKFFVRVLRVRTQNDNPRNFSVDHRANTFSFTLGTVPRTVQHKKIRFVAQTMLNSLQNLRKKFVVYARQNYSDVSDIFRAKFFRCQLSRRRVRNIIHFINNLLDFFAGIRFY